jgi:hypothetical protein
MNTIILTPDRVGSTLLQRVLTIYMASLNLDKVAVNLHELSNGLEYYFSDVFNQFMLGKPGNGIGGGSSVSKWGYHQTLPEVVELLNKVDHYKISRLAHYHLIKRNDSIADQATLYKYINDNFYIIACQRKNVFEYALSWGISSYTKKLNVYSHIEKIQKYKDLYKNKCTIAPQTLIKQLDAYKNYIEWTRIHFNVNDFFIYEDNSPNIEKFISNLDLMTPYKTKSWETMFGIEWGKWNKCHRLMSDMVFMGDNVELLENTEYNDSLTPVLVSGIKSLPIAEQQFLQDNIGTYVKSVKSIDKMVEDKVMVTGVPIKLQTLAEKKLLIKNFDELMIVYNEWAIKNNYECVYGEQLKSDSMAELANWYEDLPNQKLKNLLN